jgi:hypothetical protein
MRSRGGMRHEAAVVNSRFCISRPCTFQYRGESRYAVGKEGTVRGDTFIIKPPLLQSSLLSPRDVHVLRRIIIYEMNLPSYIIDAVADTSARTSDTIIIHCAFVGCYSDSGLLGDLCQRCLRAPKALKFGVGYPGIFIHKHAAIIGVAEEYGGAERSGPPNAEDRQCTILH